MSRSRIISITSFGDDDPSKPESSLSLKGYWCVTVWAFGRCSRKSWFTAHVCVCVLLKKRGVYLYTCAKAAVYKVHTKGQYLTGSMAVVFLADDLPSSKLPPSQAYPPSSHHGKLHQLAWAAAVILKISMKHGKLINHFCLYSWNMILLINHYLLIIELFTVTSK